VETRTENVTFDLVQSENKKIMDDYIEARKIENNISPNFQKLAIRTLNYISRYTKKNFKDVTRDDLVSYLNSVRKSEAEDPNHRWIGTYNTYLIILITFFKWLYYPMMEPKERPKPELFQNVKHLKRKEKSAYKPTDMWTQEDDLLFLKYCPSKRDRAYHTMSRDTSCRPSELLGLRIKDLVFKVAGNRQYAEILVNGKTGTRSIPLINSIPYVKDMLDSHPQKNNPNAYLIYNERVFGRRISIFGLFHMYKRYKTRVFPSLIKDTLLDSNDKAKIEELLKKPWNPYIRRHSALTEKSKILKEHTLRQHAGWTTTSNMHQKYVHYFGNESTESILEAYGLINKNKEEVDKLKPKRCPNCNEEIKVDSKFCVKCRMVLSYDAYTQVIEENETEKQGEIATLRDRLDGMKARIEHLTDLMEIRDERESKLIDELYKDYKDRQAIDRKRS
jgi:integrase